MNSLNILSARVIGPTPPQTPISSRSRSYSDSSLKQEPTIEKKPKRSASQHVKGGPSSVGEEKKADIEGNEVDQDKNIKVESDVLDEKTPLLAEKTGNEPLTKPTARQSMLHQAARRLVAVLTASLRRVLSTIALPGLFLVAGFFDERGKFSPLLPLRKLGRVLPKRNGGKSTAQAVGLFGSSDIQHDTNRSSSDKNGRRKTQQREPRRKSLASDSFSAASSGSEPDTGEMPVLPNTSSGSRSRLQSSSSSEDVPRTRRSIRIKLYNEDTTRRRKQRKEKSDSGRSASAISNGPEAALSVANLKSPTSPASSLRITKYPRAPAPPRPLIPRRQPSYSTLPLGSSRLAQKTLVIDLDETLIHSLAKGGRMSSGHMVEVKLNTIVGYGGTTLGPQHPILYYVHKRPHCDDFLRRVSKWYNLVVFTASVQEYADPVIDWLEQERKYFSGRFYRQHCTFRNGAYIKDLSSVEPDLSKVMILDNSPLSYIFHEGTISPGRIMYSVLFVDCRQRHTDRGMDKRPNRQ